MLLCMTDLLGLILSTILVLLIELIESALEHLVGILRYINVYVLLLLKKGDLFIMGWARVRRVTWVSISSGLIMCDGGVRSICIASCG